MEISEATRRVLQLHWRLIGVCVAASLAVFVTIGVTRPRTFTSSARIVLDTPDPQNVAEATANADTARAIATGGDQIQNALSQVGVRRDPIRLAKKYINVQAIGSSGVIKLSVTDTNPTIATGLANALATQVIATRLRVGRGQIALAPQLEQRVAALDTNITTLRAEIQSLNARIAKAGSPATATALTQTRNETQNILDFLTAERAALGTQQTEVSKLDALRSNPSIIQVASPPPKADPSEIPQLIGLGLLLGLVLGVGAAASVEALRPTLVGSRSLGVALGMLPLADIVKKKRFRQQRIAAAAERILLAGEAVGAKTVELVPVAPLTDLGPLAAKLEWELRMLRLRRLARVTPRDVGFTVRPFDSAASDPAAAIVVVSAAVVRKWALEETSALVKVLKKPVLGLITYHPLPRRKELSARSTEHEPNKDVVVVEETPAAQISEASDTADAPKHVQRAQEVRTAGPGQWGRGIGE